ncbi:MAG: hypothetical protein GY679_00175 [Mycoplasma sp.]|nr:hypothetical protein [Mycoplasma sp.]
MAYTKQQKESIFKEIVKAIKGNKLKHFSYIGNFIEPDVKTLERWGWKTNDECPECLTIKSELAFNKISSKIKLINKWEDSDNPTLQIAAFKLIATDEEQKALSTNYQQTEHSGEIKTTPIKGITFDEWYTLMTTEN